MLPGTIAHETSHALAALAMGSRIKEFSVLPSGDMLGRVEHTAPKIPIIGNTFISIAPLIGCPAILLLTGRFLGANFDPPQGALDLIIETRFLVEGTVDFMTGLDYLNWKTYVFLYLSLTLGAGAAPSKTDLISMFPGLIIIVAALYALNYFGISMIYPNIILSWFSAVLSVAIIPLLAVSAVVAMVKVVMISL